MQISKTKSTPRRFACRNIIFPAVGALLLGTQAGCSQVPGRLGAKDDQPVNSKGNQHKSLMADLKNNALCQQGNQDNTAQRPVNTTSQVKGNPIAQEFENKSIGDQIDQQTPSCLSKVHDEFEKAYDEFEKAYNELLNNNNKSDANAPDLSTPKTDPLQQPNNTVMQTKVNKPTPVLEQRSELKRTPDTLVHGNRDKARDELKKALEKARERAERLL